MIFTKDMINLRIYKRPVFLPTLENGPKPNKKTKSLIYLLTPDRNSSIRLISHPMTINRTRYQSYYIEKDLTHFINSRILNADNLDESAYITEGVETIDNLTISGFDKDVSAIQSFLTPDIYRSMINDLACYERSPIMNVVVGDFPEYDRNFVMTCNTEDNSITVRVPRCTTVEREEYAKRVMNYLFKSLVIYKFPDTVMTTIPAIVADAFTGADTPQGDYGRYLFFGSADGTESTVVPNMATFWDLVSREDYKGILNILEKKFDRLRITDISFGDTSICGEASTPITMENLNRKFKYASTSKFKRQFSTKINSIKRALENISTNFSSNNFVIPTVGSSGMSVESALDGLTENEDYFMLNEDTVLFLHEDNKYDLKLKELLYRDRIRSSKEILNINKAIKKDCPVIKYAFPTIQGYKQKNLFVDLYYYNQVFFKNNTWQQKRGFDLYLDLLNRLVNDYRFVKEGYEKKSIFIPINDWNTQNAARMWLYRENINPISILYELMMRNPQKVKQVFKDTDIVFFGQSSIFKINFSEFKDSGEIKKQANKFRTFIIKITQNEAFDATDVDVDTNTKPSGEAIKADLYDRFEDAQGIDLTGKDQKANKAAAIAASKSQFGKSVSKGELEANKDFIASDISGGEKIPESEPDPNLSKGVDKAKQEEKDAELEAIAAKFAKYADKMPDTDEAIDAMEEDRELKDLLRQIDANEDPSIKISTTRASRINNLSQELLDKKIEDRSIKDILSKNQSKNTIESTKLNIATPNDDWENLTYMNFDKKYDLDADIVACFNHFTTTTLPLAIRDISVSDNSTSEDRLKLYTVKYEDFNGKRHTVRLDIPIPIDNRFLLRGNNKVIATQFLNMPILKTDLGTAQIITNYQKIYVRRYNESMGRSTPIASMLIKALQKYTGNKLKITLGDNSRICNKYELPIDYIDIASVINTIEIPSKKWKIYFNQDELRKDYGEYIDESKGVPYRVETDTKVIHYYTNMANMFANQLINDLFTADQKFIELVDDQRASASGTYTRCKILGTLIPLVVVASYIDGLDKVLQKAGITYEWKEKLTQDDRNDNLCDWIKYSDGYLVYRINYTSSLLLNGLKDCPTEMYSFTEANNKKMYIEFLDNFGGRIKADGIDNFNDCLIDPITKEVMEYYGLPTEFVSVLLYTNNLLADNKFIKHTDTSSRRIRRAEMVAAYTYEALSEGYGMWANQVRHGRKDAEFKIRQSEVIDKLMASPISQDDSINNALGAVEETNNISFKGKAGLNKDRAYSLDKRTFDESMLNVLGASTAFSGNVGIGRASTINMNVDNVRGYIKQIDSDTSKMNTANSLTATEAMIPFEVNRDDNTRVSMSFIQTAKHQVRTNKADPLLVTSGIDEVLPYNTTDTFAFKAKEDGQITELVEGQYIIITYKSGQKEYVSLQEEIKKNSDGGYYIPIQLIPNKGLKAGSRVKANQIVAYDPKSFTNSLGESDNIAYEAGDLVKVAIINSDEGFEDSGLCTERLAKELTTQVIYKFEHVIEKDAIIYAMKKIGDYVNVGDSLLVWQDSFEDEDANALLRVMGKDTVEASELGRKTIKSETTGTVVGIKIYRTCELDEMSDTVRKMVKAYEAPIKELKKKLESEGIPTGTLPATYSLPSVGKLKRADDALYIEFYVQHDDIVGVGDKIVFFAANKAIIRHVVPDELSPYTDYRKNEPISAFVSVVSINKRMVTSTLVNGAINKILIEMDRKIKEKAGIPFDDTQV